MEKIFTNVLKHVKENFAKEFLVSQSRMCDMNINLKCTVDLSCDMVKQKKLQGNIRTCENDIMKSTAIASSLYILTNAQFSSTYNHPS